MVPFHAANKRLLCPLVVALAAGSAGEAGAQQIRMPGTLRYGSGYLEIPGAAVLPHLALTGTYSAFSVHVDHLYLTDPQGRVVALGDELDRWYADASMAIGLFDRVEVGATFQSFASEEDGGSMVGAFGRFLIVRPADGGVGLAAGARYVTSPTFEGEPGGRDHQPGRLGFPDRRLYKDYRGGAGEFSTNFSPYLVGTVSLPGPDARFLPDHDYTLTLGYGGGMFRAGGDLEFYSDRDGNGWFAGGAVHLALGDRTVLDLMGEYSGFSVNLGAQVDVGGLRVGAFALGVNHTKRLTEYRSRKYGLMGSVALCPAVGWFCEPALIERSEPEMIRLPAPPPDTVVVREAPPPPPGTSVELCLATGETLTALVTARGDTLVGEQRVDIRTLRPGMELAGIYAHGMEWYASGDTLAFQGRSYRRSGGVFSLECGDIRRVGEYGGVPLFVRRGAALPFQSLFVPIRPGVWQEYGASR